MMPNTTEHSQLSWLPDFLIVGAAKAGTTSLYYYLSQHPDVFFPVLKEPRFFVCHGSAPLDTGRLPFQIAQRVDDIGEYQNLFVRARPTQLKGEASTDYLYAYESAIPQIHSIYRTSMREPAIIMMLRYPPERAWSHYQMHCRDGKEDLDFFTAVSEETVRRRVAAGWPISFDYLGYGSYYRQVGEYLANFSRVFICTFEDFVAQPQITTRRVLSFLGIDEEVRLETDKRYNSSGQPRGLMGKIISILMFRHNIIKSSLRTVLPVATRHFIKNYISGRIFEKTMMPSSIVEYLNAYYLEDIEALRGILGETLNSWPAVKNNES
jgi:hypothetical protein